jgi:hypothetical protein
VGQAALLEGRDLGLVEDVVHRHAVARDGHLGEVVDREVPERVRLRGGRQRDERKRGDQRRSQSHAPESACTALSVEAARVTVWPHRPTSRASTGDNPGERRAAASSGAASAGSPAARAATPAWARNAGSREPSASARCAQRSPAAGRPARVSAQPSASAERTLGAAAHARRPSRTACAGEP